MTKRWNNDEKDVEMRRWINDKKFKTWQITTYEPIHFFKYDRLKRWQKDEEDEDVGKKRIKRG